MQITFKYIRNRIREHSKSNLLQACYNILDDKKDKHKPIWYVFLLMKWTYLYGGESYPLKPLTDRRLSNILKSITDFNSEHISGFIKGGNLNRAMQILYSQQFYLQTSVYKEKFATQLKLYSSLKSKYDIGRSFETKTGFTVFDFIHITELTWLAVNIDELKKDGLYFDGYLGNDFLKIASEVTDVEKVRSFLKLLVLDPINPNDKIAKFKRSLKREELQSMERTFFTQYPFQYFNNRIKLVHKSVFNYVINYYIYDYLKSNDDKFTTEFGLRLEKYIELGIKEMKYDYLREVDLKKTLPKGSNLVDFVITKDNIFIESKAVELQPYPSINPTDELLFNSLKDSLLKAYFKQLINVSKVISANDEGWGIILTYKKLFWSDFSDLYELGKDKFDEYSDIKFLPPENVFIIDVYTWDRIVNIVKDENTTLLKILKLAKKNNSNHKTKKQSFDMHLDVFENNSLNLSYLKEELKQLKIE